MVFKLGNHYLDKEEEKFETPRRAICPKCGENLVRRGNLKDGYYFTHCRRVWTK